MAAVVVLIPYLHSYFRSAPPGVRGSCLLLRGAWLWDPNSHLCCSPGDLPEVQIQKVLRGQLATPPSDGAGAGA